MSSRWADAAEDAADAALRKAEKEERKGRKREKQLKAQEERDAAAAVERHGERTEDFEDRPPKRRRGVDDDGSGWKPPRFRPPGWTACSTPTRFSRLNHIEEGSYGHVYRARDNSTGEVVALKKLKLDPIRDAGLPVTALREIRCLQAAGHRNIVTLREVVTADGDPASDVCLVMEFIEHDLKTLQEYMRDPFMPSEIKTLMLQLGSAVGFLHDHWILHRDLKTSNILMNNRGEVRLADFGMARFCGDPAPSDLTRLVVTLWYRAPELLLGTATYDHSVDMWSVGCILGELMDGEPLLQGRNEVDQLGKIFDFCGIPDDGGWPGFRRLPNARTLRLPPGRKGAAATAARSRFPTLTDAGVDLLTGLLSLNPAKRPSAGRMLDHPYFSEQPRPKDPASFPTFPSRAGQERRRRRATPDAPVRGQGPGAGGLVDFSSLVVGA